MLEQSGLDHVLVPVVDDGAVTGQLLELQLVAEVGAEQTFVGQHVVPQTLGPDDP